MSNAVILGKCWPVHVGPFARRTDGPLACVACNQLMSELDIFAAWKRMIDDVRGLDDLESFE